MKYIHGKFQKNISFVKPLYRRVNPKCLFLPKINDNVSKCAKLEGRDVFDKKISNTHDTRVVRVEKCRQVLSRNNNYRHLKSASADDGGVRTFCKNVDVKEGTCFDNRTGMLGIINANATDDRRGQFRSDDTNTFKAPDSWLRVYPAPIKPGESICSIVFRCVLCQIGLTFILVMWTMGWMIVIYQFEGPYEKKVSLDFQNRQHQLVIELATQLRQMTPVSPKWRKIIKLRIEEERQLTIEAVGNGARLRPGRFWDLSGTFLFTVYVMTALGFGAPVPHTIGGRTSTLVYAILAVPTQIYLMVNASTCIVIHMEDSIRRLMRSVNEVRVFKLTDEHDREHGSRKTEEKNKCRRKFSVLIGFICVGRCMPLTIFTYYVFGVLIFGLTRNKAASEMVMFPLEFTTTGGLEKVESHVRILYGLYVEGAMMLLACALDAVRRQSGSAATSMSQKYRLFESEPCPPRQNE